LIGEALALDLPQWCCSDLGAILFYLHCHPLRDQQPDGDGGQGDPADPVVSSGIGSTPSGAVCLSHKRIAMVPIASAILAATPSTTILTAERSVGSTGINASF
jgi:hypothetical protein